MKRIDLTEGNILRLIIALTLPLIGSSLLQFTYNFVDMLFVGRLGADAVASVGSAGFLMGLGYSLQAFVVIGGGIKIAHAIGRKNEEEIRYYIHSAVIINGVIGILYILFVYFFGPQFIDFLDLNNVIVERDTYRYLLVSAPAMFFSFYVVLFTRIFNSFGNNKSSLKISSIGIIINIILDPIFIFVLDFGVIGAALATLIANAVMFILFLSFSKGLFFVHPRKMVWSRTSVQEITFLGFPMSTQRILFTFVNIILAKMIASFGTEAIAAQKIGLQVEGIFLMVTAAFNGAISSFVGQNFGAKQYQRIHQGYKITISLGMLYAVITGGLFIVFSNPIAHLFVDDITTVAITSYYLKIIGLATLFASIEMISNGVFTGLGLPKIPATISIILTVLRIPLAFVLMKKMGINGIWWAIAISSILKGLVVFLVYQVRFGKELANGKAPK